MKDIKEEALEKNRFQDDLDKAEGAINVGSTLSGISTFIHIVAVIVLFYFTGTPNEQTIFITIGIGLGALLSWAIIHSILSIVVTNGLTAKHVIYQPSK